MFLRIIYEAIKDDLAAVIVEPIAGNMGFVPGIDKFLQAFTSLTEEADHFDFDESVMSGFRVFQERKRFMTLSLTLLR